jgi:hypothetical protein
VIPPFENRTPDEIINEQYVDDSAWHVHASLSWAYYADRKRAPIALHYAGFHLRYGIECLWLKIFSVARGMSFTVDDYKRAVKNATKLYKLIDSFAPDYAKFAEFDQIIQLVDSTVHPPTVIWDIAKLRRFHGECGELLLHLQEAGAGGYLSENWIQDRTKFLRESAGWIWDTMRSRGNLVVYHPDGLSPAARHVWESFRAGETDTEGARIRLQIIRPMHGR